MPNNRDTIVMEGVRITFLNFSGIKGQYNQAGERNFVVLIDDDAIAAQMAADGWNIRMLRSREEDDPPQPSLKVNVNYDKGRPPRIVMLGRRRTVLDEETVSVLDDVHITNVDIIINPYNYDFNGRQGISAYLQTMYVTIKEDPLELKYMDMEFEKD